MARTLLSLLFTIAVLSSADAQQYTLPPISKARNEHPISIEKMQELQIGRPFGDFSAQGLDGSIINNQKLLGKVSLVLFWYPSISFSNRKYVGKYLDIDTISALQKLYKNFQILSLLPDSSGLALFQLQNPETRIYRAALLPSFTVAQELNPGIGMPSGVVVDQHGNIARVTSLGYLMNQDAVADKIKDLMMP